MVRLRWVTLVFFLAVGCPTATSSRQLSPPPSATSALPSPQMPGANLACPALAHVPNGSKLYCIHFASGSTIPFGDSQTETVAAPTTFTGTIQFALPDSWPSPSTTPNALGRYLFIDLMTSASLPQTCDLVAHHHLQPFGSSPKIRMGQYADQPGCLITASRDQAPAWYDQAEALIQLPGSVSISGDAGSAFNTIALEAPSGQIEAILGSLVIRAPSS